MKQIAAALAAVLALSCATARPHSEDSVRAALAQFSEALNSLDLNAISACLADDVTSFVPLRQAERVDGKPAVVEIFRRYIEATKATTSRTNFQPEDLQVSVSGDMAFTSFNVRSADQVARRTTIFRWNGSRWLIVHMHGSQMLRANVVK